MTTRRGFLSGLFALAATQAIPFNRVWSFPKEIVIPKREVISATIGQYSDYILWSDSKLLQLSVVYYDKHVIDNLKTNTPFYNMIQEKPLPEYTGNKLQFYNYKLEIN